MILLFLAILLTGEGADLFAQRRSSLRSVRGLSRPSASLSRRISALERQRRLYPLSHIQEQKYQSMLFDKARRATFRAFSYTPSSANAFTGTILKVKHEGKSEIVGVIASHTLQGTPHLEGLLNQEFKAVYVHGNVALDIPAKVVQFTHPSLGDLALVKFPKEYEQIFDPIPLEEVSIELPARGYSQGYARNNLFNHNFFITGETSTGMLTSQLPPVQAGDRAGLCGSPVFTTDFQLAGIHVGSSYRTHVGYISPVANIYRLLQSYYQPDSPAYTIKLAGKDVAQLGINEYIADIEILDINYNTLWKHHTRTKFSVTQAEAEVAQNPQAAFVRLTIGNSSWQQDPMGSYVFDDISKARILITPLK